MTATSSPDPSAGFDPAPHAVSVVATGLVTALGFGTEPVLDALLAGRSGVRETEDAAGDAARGLAAPVAPPYIRRGVPPELDAQLKFLNGAGALAVEAALEAWGRAGWSSAASDGGRQGLWLAQMDAFDWSCFEMRPAFALATEGFQKPPEAEALNRAAARYVKPFFLLESLKNNAFSFLANLFDLRGPNTSVSGYAGPSVVLLDLAARALLRGDLDRALVVGAGRAASAVARNDEALLGLRRAGPTPLPGPFDARGVGLAPGEAAAALCLGRPDGRTGADLLLAAVEASGAPQDDLPAPRGETARRAAAEALASARVGPEDLAFVVAPSLGVPDADRDVLEALASLPAVSGAPVVSWGGALGRLALADGLAEVVVALAALRRGAVPGTVGCREPISVRARVALAPFEPHGKAALVLSSGRHGEVSAAVVTTGARVG